jgi:hypothetical protein
MFKFNSFYLDSNRKQEVRLKMDKILESIEHKMWWYKHSNIDDFESSNVINEIDTRYKFEKIESIWEKRDKK